MKKKKVEIPESGEKTVANLSATEETVQWGELPNKEGAKPPKNPQNVYDSKVIYTGRSLGLVVRAMKDSNGEHSICVAMIGQDGSVMMSYDAAAALSEVIQQMLKDGVPFSVDVRFWQAWRSPVVE